MTIRINIEVDSYTDLPPEFVKVLPELARFVMADKALDEAAAATEGADQKEAPHPTPLPASGERERAEEEAPEAPPGPAQPYAEIVALLKQDLETADVTALLIIPLLARWPELRGDPKHVLSKTAQKFKAYSKRKLEFAREWLLKGNHALFPDYNEIYAALGRYESYKDREKGGDIAA